MVQREEYMKRIRPFIGNELVKVLTGLRRSGKSVMLELIKKELLSQGIPDSRFVSFTFENMSNAYLCTAKALHEKVKAMIGQSSGKFYLFFDEIPEVQVWE
jgi:predicted AAA+ superfamily ATPase